MIKVSVMFPSGEGRSFDMDYYVRVYMPLAQRVFGDALKRFEVEKGLSGPFPGSEPPYLAIGHLHFESVEAFMPIMMANASRLMEDIPNFTNASPTIQISEVIQ
jgi:uncharacterized protein (TIGR02118 family)